MKPTPLQILNSRKPNYHRPAPKPASLSFKTAPFKQVFYSAPGSANELELVKVTGQPEPGQYSFDINTGTFCSGDRTVGGTFRFVRE